MTSIVLIILYHALSSFSSLDALSYPLHLMLVLLFLTAMWYALHRAVLLLHVLVGPIVIVLVFLAFSRRCPLWKLNGVPSAPPFAA
jgi:high-affinity Fe2+/Pb2+ permease